MHRPTYLFAPAPILCPALPSLGAPPRQLRLSSVGSEGTQTGSMRQVLQQPPQGPRWPAASTMVTSHRFSTTGWSRTSPTLQRVFRKFCLTLPRSSAACIQEILLCRDRCGSGPVPSFVDSLRASCDLCGQWHWMPSLEGVSLSLRFSGCHFGLISYISTDSRSWQSDRLDLARPLNRKGGCC